jgi:hypothetical protein
LVFLLFVTACKADSGGFPDETPISDNLGTDFGLGEMTTDEMTTEMDSGGFPPDSDFVR